MGLISVLVFTTKSTMRLKVRHFRSTHDMVAIRLRRMLCTALLKGIRAPRDVITSPGASKRALMPQVGRTRGWPAGGDARGEPPPPS